MGAHVAALGAMFEGKCGVAGTKGEVEGSTFLHFAFGPDFAAMTVDDALNGCESDPSAGEFGE